MTDTQLLEAITAKIKETSIVYYAIAEGTKQSKLAGEILAGIAENGRDNKMVVERMIGKELAEELFKR
jgi:hypothetical protein